MPLRPCLAVDSDGSVLDSMTVKHTHAFTPALIETFGLAAVADVAGPAFLQLNLYSPERGTNRFLALASLLTCLPALLPGHRQSPLPDLSLLLDWIRTSPSLSARTLQAECALHPADDSLARALAYSRAVDRRVAALPPATAFAGANRALRNVVALGTVVVVSSAPTATLRHEWAAAGLADMPTAWGGQEAGTKIAQLRELRAASAPQRPLLMVGDAPADHEAAVAAGVPFFPIVPGAEAECWEAFASTILPAWVEARPDLDDHLAAWEQRFWQTLASPPPQPVLSA